MGVTLILIGVLIIYILGIIIEISCESESCKYDWENNIFRTIPVKLTTRTAWKTLAWPIILVFEISKDIVRVVNHVVAFILLLFGIKYMYSKYYYVIERIK